MKQKISYIKQANLCLMILFSQILFSQPYIPGNTYYDTTGYVKYIAGNLPIIISAPHGGGLEPSSIPDRNCTNCVYEKDGWTLPITEGFQAAFVAQTGCYPHIIINLLHRKKFDANRDIGDAADGNPTVEQAWNAYHGFIDAAKSKSVTDYGRGLFLDIHGHGHTIQRIELGYLLSRSELQLSDSNLNTNTYINQSSVRKLVASNILSNSHADLLRGANSFGNLLANAGFPSVPSQNIPFPLTTEPYYDGGYNTQRHGSRDNNGPIDAIQIELNSTIRNDATTRQNLINTLSTTANQYINIFYNNQYATNFCNLLNTSENNSEQYDFKIYPNPTEDFININTNLADLEIEIYNNLGQKLHTESFKGSKIKIDFLAAGCYILQIKKDKQSLKTKKFIKK
jgi:hypothetical protein